MGFSIFVKKKIRWDFDRDYIESIDCSGQYWHLNFIKSSNPWTGMCFHLFMSSLISLSNVLQFSLYMSFPSLVKLILKNFNLFDTIVNGIVFIISFSDGSLLIYWNATDFCVLTLYPATLLNLKPSRTLWGLPGTKGFPCPTPHPILVCRKKVSTSETLPEFQTAYPNSY